MSVAYFPVAVTQDEDGTFIAKCVDMPNVFSDGKTIGEAWANVEDALAAVIDVMRAHGEAVQIPAIRSLEDLRKENPFAVYVFAKAQVANARAVKISVTMDEELLKRIDASAGNYGRSEFLAMAAREKLARSSAALIPESYMDAVMNAIAQGLPLTVDDDGTVRSLRGAPSLKNPYIRQSNMTKHYPKGLDGRMRDDDGEIRHKRGDTLVRTLREEYGPDFAPGYRSDTKLETVLEREGVDTLRQLLRKK